PRPPTKQRCEVDALSSPRQPAHEPGAGVLRTTIVASPAQAWFDVPTSRSGTPYTYGFQCARPPAPACRAGLRRRAARSPGGPRHVLGYRVLVDAMAEFRQLTGDPPSTPERVLTRHPLDETHPLRRERGATHPPRPPRPEPGETAPMPSNHGRRFDNRQRLRPPRPQTGHHNPERTVDGPQPRPMGRPA